MLNAHYAVLRVISVRRALSLVFKENHRNEPVAEIVHVEDGRYISYNFDDWRELSEFQREFEPHKFDWIRTVRFHLAVPRIIRVFHYNKVPRHQVRLNRRNIFARDRSRCQYCGKRFPTSELSLDHVVPRSQNGPLTWENIVCCCLKCNVRKGGRTPTKAGMKLIARPVKPSHSPVLTLRLSDDRYSSWRHFVNEAYWNVELQ